MLEIAAFKQSPGPFCRDAPPPSPYLCVTIPPPRVCVLRSAARSLRSPEPPYVIRCTQRYKATKLAEDGFEKAQKNWARLHAKFSKTKKRFPYKLLCFGVEQERDVILNPVDV